MSGTQNIFTLWRHFDGTNYYNTHAHGSTGHRWYIVEMSIRVHSNGNVGIGTNNPQCILDINKDIAGGVNYVDIRNHHALVVHITCEKSRVIWITILSRYSRCI